jgi:DNA-directed RNA polymerase subunit RPC12/RpoP
MRTVYRWKCQKCGHDWTRLSKDEPIQCPVCLDKGAKSYEGKEKTERV